MKSIRDILKKEIDRKLYQLIIELTGKGYGWRMRFPVMNLLEILVGMIPNEIRDDLERNLNEIS